MHPYLNTFKERKCMFRTSTPYVARLEEERTKVRETLKVHHKSRKALSEKQNPTAADLEKIETLRKKINELRKEEKYLTRRISEAS